MLNIDSIFGIHEQSVNIRSLKAQHIAKNIANSDTPGYKAMDIDFKKYLNQYPGKNNLLFSTLELNNSHMQHQNNLLQPTPMLEAQYRIPFQSSLDGNTVDTNLEKSEYASNALRLQASITFLNGKIKSIMGAIKGK